MQKVKMHNILILHGWGSNSQDHWFQEAKEELVKRNYQVHIPDLSNNMNPQEIEWVKVIKDLQPDENWILVGHSLGGTTILRYLEQTDQPVAKSVIISTPINDLGVAELANFFQKPFDWQKIRHQSKEIVVLNSTDDPVVPIDHGETIAEKTGGKLIIKEGYDHGFDNAPLQLIIKMITGSQDHRITGSSDLSK